jgi:hypothetical protein
LFGQPGHHVFSEVVFRFSFILKFKCFQIYIFIVV